MAPVFLPEFFYSMRKIMLITIVFFIAGCAGNDKKAAPGNTIAGGNISGEILFKANCASCHKIDKDFTGPALKGAVQRWGDKKLMYDFIRNSSAVIRENAYARQLFEKWNRTMMTPFDLTDAQIDAIINYTEEPVQ